MRENEAVYVLDFTFLVLLIVSGLMSMVSILKTTEGQDVGKTKWVWIMLGKIILVILYSRILDIILLAILGSEGQTMLSRDQDFFCRILKFVILLVAFGLASYAHIYRRNITDNFTV